MQLPRVGKWFSPICDDLFAKEERARAIGAEAVGPVSIVWVA